LIEDGYGYFGLEDWVLLVVVVVVVGVILELDGELHIFWLYVYVKGD
jgi:hypothetical protein